MRSSKAGRRIGGWAVGFAAALLAAYPPTRLPAQSSSAPIIDTIVIVNHNIFDESEWDELPFIARAADALHVRTHASVIRRALVLNQGDRYDSARVVESERALRSLNVFRAVQVDTTRVGDRLALRVETADGWSTKPQFNFSSAGGSITWQAGIEEENVLGSATSFTALYTKTPDRSWQHFVYLNPHFFARRPRLTLSYSLLSDGRQGTWSLGVPYYETAAPRSLFTSGEASTLRVLSFRYLVDSTGQRYLVDTFGRPVQYIVDSTGVEYGVDSLGRHVVRVDQTERYTLRFGLNGGVALRASSHGYLRLWGGLVWRRENYVLLPQPSGTPVPWSSFTTVGAGLEIARSRFHFLRRFNTYARREDVNLSQYLRFGVWAAPRAWGYAAGRAGVGPEISGQMSARWRGGFIVLGGRAAGVITSAGVDSGRVRGVFTIASQNFAGQTVIVHLEGGALRRPKPGAEFDPWLDQTGPRLYPAHAVTGTRTVWLAFEDRLLLSDQAWGIVGFGVAPFFDWGGAWWEGEPMRTGGDVGMSLRLGPTRAVRGEVTEFAVGYRYGAAVQGWALTIRRGIVY